MHTNITIGTINDGVCSNNKILIISIQRVVVADKAIIRVHREQGVSSLLMLAYVGKTILFLKIKITPLHEVEAPSSHRRDYTPP